VIRGREIHPLFPQTQEFINRISELLIYLLPHYIREGKSYLTISFDARAGAPLVMIAEDVNKRLRKAGYKVKSCIGTAEVSLRRNRM